MKKGFTLIEMLVVVVVLVTLMTMVFRLGNIGSDSDRRNRTIVRLQRLENCLSGYHAAFGSYPPVKLHGTRDIERKVGGHGIQNDQSQSLNWGWTRIGETSEQNDWAQVEAACRSQPVGCRFPYPQGYATLIRAVSDAMKEMAGQEGFSGDDRKRKRLLAGFDDGGADSGNIGRFEDSKDMVDWRNIQLFKFGMMSFLLPRYLVMMNGHRSFFTDFAQWTGNNVLPCDPFKGDHFNSWQDVHNEVELSDKGRSHLAKLANIPSQAVCARWMPNLEGICHCNHSFVLFGTEISCGDKSDLTLDNTDIEIFTPEEGDGESYRDQYVLDGVTVTDGWWREFYYYSPSPYQTYTIWSAGPNGRTFPPWISKKSKKLNAKALRCIGLWTEDDIVHMSN